MEPEGEGALVYAGSIPTEGTALIQPGAAPAPTCPSRAGPVAPLGCPDFTHADIARLALSAMVLLIVGLILAEAHYSRPRLVSLDPALKRGESPRGTSCSPLGG
ncbi:unnamed protein product [Lepidochelys kempii]